MPAAPAPATIWWIRRDLRLSDNPALAAALARGGPVVPVFVRDPGLLAGAHAGAERRIAFLHAALARLDGALRARGARLIVRTGRPEAVLPQLLADTGAGLVVATSDVTPYARRRDADVARTVPIELVGGPGLRHPGEVLTGTGKPYTLFTPFSRAWLARPLASPGDLLPPPETLPRLPRHVASEEIPAGTAPAAFPATEEEALRRLAAFARGRRSPIRAYTEQRNRLDVDGTSALSPYLRLGLVSARQAVVAALEAGARPGVRRARSGPDVWLAELVWREFYLAILWHFPFVLRRAFDPSLRHVAWRDAPADLRAWQEGRTGYPIVDAGMRQLAATGWLHNRARMIVASFLTKDLLLDWRAGEAWFMRHLLDGDPAANNGGWQWTAGTGTDAAPYFRIFNPVLQARKFDPAGDWVRRWVPELARLAGPAVHEPHVLPTDELAGAGVVLGRDYPRPIVDHATVRERTLTAYQASRAGRRVSG